ncbi:MAG: AAA family ATPase, partial [Bacteroidales bacterium]|nr:AAA family ATPase [Bacteroidales bacterium]
METPIRKYPIGQQDFEYLRKNDFLYVDKTGFIYPLVTAHKQVFLSRPRRFGKSLFLSTLKYYFKGRKDLFNGLKISELEKDWTEYPVFHIEFNLEGYANLEALYQVLEKNLLKLEKIWGKETAEKTFAVRFAGLIERAAEKSGKKVVVLIDEYDKPLFATMHNKILNEEIRETLKGFYG